MNDHSPAFVTQKYGAKPKAENHRTNLSARAHVRGPRLMDKIRSTSWDGYKPLYIHVKNLNDSWNITLLDDEWITTNT